MSAVDEALASLDELDRRARRHDCGAARVAREVIGILREAIELARPVDPEARNPLLATVKAQLDAAVAR